MHGRPLGSYGELSIFSFYATKMLTTGEGGAVVSKSADFIKAVRKLRVADAMYKVTREVCYNYKMTDLQAAIGISQLKRLDSFIYRRREIAKLYNNRFSELGISIPKVYSESEHIYFRYVIRNRAPEHQSTRAPENKGQKLEDDLKIFEANGVKCMRPIFKPIHRYLGLKGLPETDRAWNELISIPIYPSLTDGDVKKIVKVTEKWWEAKVE